MNRIWIAAPGPKPLVGAVGTVTPAASWIVSAVTGAAKQISPASPLSTPAWQPHSQGRQSPGVHIERRGGVIVTVSPLAGVAT